MFHVKHMKRNQTMLYADIHSGKFDMTYEDVLQAWRDNPISTHPNDVVFVSEDGTEYTCADLEEYTGVKNECYE